MAICEVANTIHALREKWGWTKYAGEEKPRMGRKGAKGRDRTADTSIFSAVLYQLSYLGACRSRTGAP
jgi:hypothetical protein